MSYLEKGFDIFLNRSFADVYDIGEMSYDRASVLLQGVPGSNVIGGQTKSSDGKLYIDWDSGAIIASDGARSRVVVGYVAEEDGYGIKIYDASGNEVFSVAGQLTSSGLGDSSVTTTKIADLAVTNAKITSMAADKITTGDLVVAVDVGNPSTGFTRLDGVNNRIIVNDGTTNRIVIGDV